jgi:hypothetical protein
VQSLALKIISPGAVFAGIKANEWIESTMRHKSTYGARWRYCKDE